MDIKISDNRLQLRERQRDRAFNHLTPKKYTNKESKWNTMYRAEKKWGFDFDEKKCESQVLKWEKETFMDKLGKYYKGKEEGFVKKQNHHDKRDKKEALNFEVAPNRIKRTLLKIDRIMTNKLTGLLFKYASKK